MDRKDDNKNKSSTRRTAKKQKGSRIGFGLIFLTFLSLCIVFGCFVFGLGAGYFASLVKDEPVRTVAAMKQDLYDYEKTSKLYFANNEYIGDIRSDLHREKISLDKVPQTLVDAVIATEDENFYEHNGIMPKAIVRAAIQEVTNSDTKTGGSTLTQQLVKNQVLTNEVSFDRKAKEILIALRVERFFTKKQILQAYLNIIPYGREASGRNIAGIKTAANGIFGIEPEKLNLAQSAFLAGLPQSPSYYTPYRANGEFKSEEGIQPGINRMKYVLKRMRGAGYITESQMQEAMNYDIRKDFTQKSTLPKVKKYPELVYEAEKRVKEILREQIAEEDGIETDQLDKDKTLKEKYDELADRALRQRGYRIHTTINKKMYEKMQKVAKNYQYYGPDKDGERVETGSIMIENKTGKIISFVGSREYTDGNQINYAMGTVRPNGSTMKPLLDYAPAMEEGVIQPGSVFADVPKSFGNYRPNNYAGGFHGLVSARTALANSYNIPAVEIYSKIISKNPAKKYLEKMGITSLTKADHENLSLALGQPTYGISVEENVNAYATFANNGKFVDAYMIDKIETDDGKVIYQHKSKPVKVFSPQTAYLTIDMMRDVLNHGTATYVRPQLNNPSVDWAGKTGTSQDYKDAWFVATNPNVTFGTWIGYKTPKSLQCVGCSLSYSQRNEKLWAELINSAAEVNPKLVTPSKRFKQPKNIVARSYCTSSGMLPSEACSKAGLVQSDIYNAKFVPGAADDSLIFNSYGGISFNPAFLQRKGYDKLGDLSMLFPRVNTELWQRLGSGGASRSSSSQSESTSTNSSSSSSEPTPQNTQPSSPSPEPSETSNEQTAPEPDSNQPDRQNGTGQPPQSAGGQNTQTNPNSNSQGNNGGSNGGNTNSPGPHENKPNGPSRPGNGNGNNNKPEDTETNHPPGNADQD
ncbi:transglycosylase domain-containing protein [Aciduricibacillus chroicocephali]|uniref:Transglycosylase domain-containing protein n=1 Tax=Aciduricibacillus chroicocephali TaxID=3054939 RepID=A0ABY9KTB9_9BACI|nr:transglycosylase domain-containing protein [Bacillaceae bacterium 44XB]